MMKSLRQVVLCVAAVCFGLAPASAGTPSLLEFDLRSLEAPEVHRLTRYQGKPVLMVFFEPECSWCLRQVKAINKLGSRCGESFEALAIGVNGSRARLQKELRRLRPDFPAYQASPQLIESLGGIPATPLSFLGDASGGYVNWLRGYAAEDELEAFMQSTGLVRCE